MVHTTVVPGATLIEAGLKANGWSELVGTFTIVTMATTGVLVGVLVGAPGGKVGALVGVPEDVGVAVAVFVGSAVGVGAPGATTMTCPVM